MHSCYNSTTSNKEPLEQAKDALKLAETSLSAAVHQADSEIQKLRQAEIKRKQQLEAATERYNRVKEMTEILCHDCFSVLPALGIDRATLKQHNPHACASCGQSLRAGHSSVTVEMPPATVSGLEYAVDSQAYASEINKGSSTSSFSDFCGASRVSSVIPGLPGLGQQVPKQWSHEKKSNHSYGYDHHHHLHYGQSNGALESTMKKENFLERATKPKESAQKHLAETTYAIEQWQKYREQHRAELDKVKASSVDVQDRERKVLQAKLAKLGGGTATTSPDTGNCSICFERPKEIVFQCGHQCCSQCSLTLAHCHTCRAAIIQRIKLFH